MHISHKGFCSSNWVFDLPLDMWYAVGIAIDNSWACRLGQNYGVYTDTAFHKPWIVKTVLDDSL